MSFWTKVADNVRKRTAGLGTPRYISVDEVYYMFLTDDMMLSEPELEPYAGELFPVKLRGVGIPTGGSDLMLDVDVLEGPPVVTEEFWTVSINDLVDTKDPGLPSDYGDRFEV